MYLSVVHKLQLIEGVQFSSFESKNVLLRALCFDIDPIHHQDIVLWNNQNHTFIQYTYMFVYDLFIYHPQTITQKQIIKTTNYGK